jgi:hypothetical protein
MMKELPQTGHFVSKALITIGQSVHGYTPVGILDGLGAYELDDDTVRVLANHELLHFRGSAFEVSDGAGGAFTMTGARVSYFDIDKDKREIVAAGPAIEMIYDATGAVATDVSFQPSPWAPFFGEPTDSAPLAGLSRLCSSALFEPGGAYSLANRIYFAGEEDGTGFNSVGGAEWALDPSTGDLWALPDLGRGAWENVTLLDTGDSNTVAVLLADDSSPFDFDGDAADEAAPLFLYIGTKDPSGDFPARNGLRGGSLYVWVSDSGEMTPADFNTAGTLEGSWMAVDNTPKPGMASENGVSGYDEYGYPTQGNLWLQAKVLGAFGFSRPEDVATNPEDATEAVMASTGVDSYVGGADLYGTLYTIKTDFSDLSADLTIIYDGDADVSRALRSPDNLDWASNGLIYVQEDEAEETDNDGLPLFGTGATNPNEAGIVIVDPADGSTQRVANIRRNVVLDGSVNPPQRAVDVDAGSAGEWESSGILDVSTLFDEEPGTLFLFDVQAHGIEDQEDFNPTSRINDGDLVEGGQLLFLERKPKRGRGR